MSIDSEKLKIILEKVNVIIGDYQVLSQVNLSFKELNLFNERVHELAILINQNLESLTTKKYLPS